MNGKWMMTIRRLATGIFPWFILVCAFGQDHVKSKDFSTRWKAEVSKTVGFGIGLTAELEQRFRNNSLQYDRSLATLSGEYRVSDFLDVSAGFRVLLDNDNEDGISVRSRWHADATGRYAVENLKFTLRTRIQYGFAAFPGRSDPGWNRWINRYRLRVEQHIFGTKFGWVASVEPWFRMNGDTGHPFASLRLAAGIRYAPDFVSRFSLRYIREEEYNVVDPLQSNVLVVGYSRNL